LCKRLRVERADTFVAARRPERSSSAPLRTKKADYTVVKKIVYRETARLAVDGKRDAPEVVLLEKLQAVGFCDFLQVSGGVGLVARHP